MTVSIPNGQRGLRSAQSWLLDENRGLREALTQEREKSSQKTERIRDLERQLETMRCAA